jgi:RimJ/RimL family protein N-acetyltransferase
MSLDEHGRIAGSYSILIAAARDGSALFAGSDVPDALMPALLGAMDSSSRAAALDIEPPALGVCREILQRPGVSLMVENGPTFLIAGSYRATESMHILRSDASGGGELRCLNPGNWEPDEWDDLLDGVLGPWAIAVADGVVASICHTPAPMTAQAAECGVWTHPGYRGQGYAAAVTATWADILRPSARSLFYSTDAENRSSRRVAERLNLRLIGWAWRLTAAKHGDQVRRHPLSRPLSHD